MKQMMIIVTLTFSLFGCKEDKVYDVQHYLDHPKERQEQIEKCRNNPTALGQTPNCQNAFTAEAKSSFRGTKSIELPVLKIK